MAKNRRSRAGNCGGTAAVTASMVAMEARRCGTNGGVKIAGRVLRRGEPACCSSCLQHWKSKSLSTFRLSWRSAALFESGRCNFCPTPVYLSLHLTTPEDGAQIYTAVADVRKFWPSFRFYQIPYRKNRRATIDPAASRWTLSAGTTRRTSS